MGERVVVGGGGFLGKKVVVATQSKCHRITKSWEDGFGKNELKIVLCGNSGNQSEKKVGGAITRTESNFGERAGRVLI